MPTNSHSIKNNCKYKGENIMLEFNQTLEEVIAAQESTTREKAFLNLGTKKQIMDSDAFSDVQKDYIFRLKNTYSFELHKSGRYMVITMYYGKTKKYDFIILDLNTLRCATADSIKNAKLAVMELANSLTYSEENVEEQVANVEEQPAEVAEEVQEEPAEEGQEEETAGKTTSKKTKK